MASPAAAQDFPALTGRVVDAAEILPADAEDRLTAQLETLETQTQAQFVIATVPTLEGYAIEDYGYRLGREWAIGDAERNDGVILLVAPVEREVRIEVGYGLEGVLTDALSKIIIENDILPEFRRGEYASGIEAGAQAIVIQLGLPEEEALARARAASEQSELEPSQIVFIVVMFVLVTLFPILFFLVPFVIFLVFFPRRYKKWKKEGGKGSIFVGGSSRSYGGFSSGGSSFSGGGGSFGGGGASGSW
ncbi:TPM domain-containing protein [Erythrobacter sp. JK5]|nr:TPM domain-containing protein [Erythrobacter sp. JK5]